MTRHDAVLGIDGCPGGWVGALVKASQVSWYGGTLASLLALPASVVAIDIPLGLPSGGDRRTCDLAARALLGPARSSVFPAPPRAVLDAVSHADASVRSRAAGSVGVSIQTWNIVPKIREASLVRDARLLEVHPELSFRTLAASTGRRQSSPLAVEPAGLPPVDPSGLPALASKKTAAGRAERVALLRSWVPFELPSPRPARAAVDDCLDALVCAWSGARWLRGAAEVLGGGPSDVDATGHVMRIVV